jgi:hypothetical protein
MHFMHRMCAEYMHHKASTNNKWAHLLADSRVNFYIQSLAKCHVKGEIPTKDWGFDHWLNKIILDNDYSLVSKLKWKSLPSTSSTQPSCTLYIKCLFFSTILDASANDPGISISLFFPEQLFFSQIIQKDYLLEVKFYYTISYLRMFSLPTASM